MPVPNLDALHYIVTKAGGGAETRKILVINGTPFYSSTGTSEDREEIIAPSWREHMWMPISGVDTTGHLCKLGSLYNADQLEDEIKELLISVYYSMPEESRQKTLRQLVLEKYSTPEYMNDPDVNKRLDDKMILTALAGQLTRFGTVEAMIISMNISPQQWSSNELLKNFKEQLRQQFTEFNHYTEMNLPTLVANAKPVKTISVNQDNITEKEEAAATINAWLLKETSKTGTVVHKALEARIEIDRIQEQLCQKLISELQAFKKRKGIAEDASLDQLDTASRLRYTLVEDLKNKIIVKTEQVKRTLKADDLNSWKPAYQDKITIAIKECLNKNGLDKYNDLEKIGIAILNCVTALLFPLALIKKNITGTFFFSTVGKSKEIVEETSKTVENIFT
jgi:hypothetical protein